VFKVKLHKQHCCLLSLNLFSLCSLHIFQDIIYCYVEVPQNFQWEVFTLPTIFHMDSIPIPWNSMDYFLAGNPAICSFHTHYGIHMECPWNGAFHMDSMEFPMNLQFINCNSMYYSIRIPWKSPYGFHVTVHLKFRGKTPFKVL
jgi:hypothetical protein